MVDLRRLLMRIINSRHEPSSGTARRRLQLVLVQDRIGLPQATMEAMKVDLLEVVSKYLVIEQDSVEMDVKNSGDSMILMSNIMVKDIVRTGALT